MKNGKWIYLLIPAVVFLAIQLLWPILPMPWPDEPVFFISGRDLIEKGIWHLPLFAYLDKTYDLSNFNTMPLYSIITYLWAKVASVEREQFLTYFQIFFALAGIFGFGIFLNRSQIDSKHKLILWGYVLLYPFLYYNSHIIRPEALIYPALILLLLVVLPYFDKNRILYSVATGAILAWGAYLHYNAIIMVLFVFIVLFDTKALRKTFENFALIAIFTLIFLIPWLYYTGNHFSEFKTHFFDQTRRMYTDLHKDSFFKSFFLSIFYTNTLGIVKKELLYYLIVLSKCIASLVFLALAITALVKKQISRLSVRLLLCLIVGVIFCAKHRESWFIIYAEIAMLAATVSIATDLFKNGSRLPKILYIGQITGLLFILAAIFYYPAKYFTGSDFDNLSVCLVSGLKQNENVVVSALPDPSVAILLKNPSINIIRMIDYPTYAKEWSELVKRENVFITARYDVKDFNGIDEIMFDHDNVLKEKLTNSNKNKLLETKICKLNDMPIYLHRIKND